MMLSNGLERAAVRELLLTPGLVHPNVVSVGTYSELMPSAVELGWLHGADYGRAAAVWHNLPDGCACA